MLQKEAALFLVVSTVMQAPGQSQTSVNEILRLEATIPMPDVQGRIDHLAIDIAGRRLFVAALGNNSIEVIDLEENIRVHTVRGLAEPQGIAGTASRNGQSHFHRESQGRHSPKFGCGVVGASEVHRLRRRCGQPSRRCERSRLGGLRFRSLGGIRR